MDPILNERSLLPTEDGRHGLDARAAQLVAVVRALQAVGARRVLRSTRDALKRDVAPTLSLRQYLSDRSTLREEKTLLKSLLGKAPFVEQLLQDQESAERALEFRLDEQPCPGLGVAHLLESPAVSLTGHAAFEARDLTVSMLCLDGYDHSEECTVEVQNFATPMQVQQRRDVLRTRVLREVRDGAALWSTRDRLFPHLEFCAPVQSQLTALSGNERYFRDICRHLFALEDACASETSGRVDPIGVEWSYESKQTLAHDRYGKYRKIICPDGKIREFSAHTKVRSANWRVHYLPVEEAPRAFIGHIFPLFGIGTSAGGAAAAVSDVAHASGGVAPTANDLAHASGGITALGQRPRACRRSRRPMGSGQPGRHIWHPAHGRACFGRQPRWPARGLATSSMPLEASTISVGHDRHAAGAAPTPSIASLRKPSAPSGAIRLVAQAFRARQRRQGRCG